MSNTYEGMAIGGPLDGREISHPGRKGFVHWNLDTEKVVVYDRNEDGNFVAGAEQDVDEDKLAKAQLDEGRKVLAFGTFPEFNDLEYEEIPEEEFDFPDDEIDSDFDGENDG